MCLVRELSEPQVSLFELLLALHTVCTLAWARGWCSGATAMVLVSLQGLVLRCRGCVCLWCKREINGCIAGGVHWLFRWSSLGGVGG